MGMPCRIMSHHVVSPTLWPTPLKHGDPTVCGRARHKRLALSHLFGFWPANIIRSVTKKHGKSAGYWTWSTTYLHMPLDSLFYLTKRYGEFMHILSSTVHWSTTVKCSVQICEESCLTAANPRVWICSVPAAQCIQSIIRREAISYPLQFDVPKLRWVHVNLIEFVPSALTHLHFPTVPALRSVRTPAHSVERLRTKQQDIKVGTVGIGTNVCTTAAPHPYSSDAEGLKQNAHEIIWATQLLQVGEACPHAGSVSGEFSKILKT